MKSHMSRFTLAALAALACAPAAMAQTMAPTMGATHPNMAAAHAAALIGFKHHELPKMFSSYAYAQAVCKSPAIWADTKTRMYYTPGTKGFGTMMPGVYACTNDAVKAGYRKSAA
jgi:hypothetical protein